MVSASDSPPGLRLAAVAIVLVAATTYLTDVGVTLRNGGPRLSTEQAGLAMVLLVALALTYRFPIHVEPRSKIYLGSIVLILIASLLPPAVAVPAAAGGTLAGELSVASRTGNLDIGAIIPTQVARWGLIALAAALVAHLPVTPAVLPAVGAAVTMWLGDILTGPLLLTPMLGRHPIAVIHMMVREGGMIEGLEYLIGLLGVVIARQSYWALALLIPPTAVIHLTFRRAHEMKAESRAILEDMADLVDARDPALGDHSRRTAALARDILGALGASGPEVDLIITAARLHDIGKITIPEEILLARDVLSPSDRSTLHAHAQRGAEILTRYPSTARIAGMIRHHHESWDGGGYPDGLRGTEIPFGSRVIAVAERYDSMVNRRSGYLPIPPRQAAAVLRDGRGRHWDPQIVDALLEARSPDLTPPLRIVGETEPDHL